MGSGDRGRLGRRWVGAVEVVGNGEDWGVLRQFRLYSGSMGDAYHDTGRDYVSGW